jgi:hypothetical protein
MTRQTLKDPKQLVIITLQHQDFAFDLEDFLIEPTLEGIRASANQARQCAVLNPDMRKPNDAARSLCKRLSRTRKAA